MAKLSPYVKAARVAIRELPFDEEADSLAKKLRDLVLLRRAWIWKNAFNRQTMLVHLFPGDEDGNFADAQRKCDAAYERVSKSKEETKAYYKAQADAYEWKETLEEMSRRAGRAVARLRQMLMDQGIYFLDQTDNRNAVSSRYYCVALDKDSLDIAVAKHRKGKRIQDKYLKVALAAASKL